MQRLEQKQVDQGGDQTVAICRSSCVEVLHGGGLQGQASMWVHERRKQMQCLFDQSLWAREMVLGIGQISHV